MFDRAEYQRMWRAKNPGYTSAYYNLHKDESNARRREKYAENPERQKQNQLRAKKYKYAKGRQTVKWNDELVMKMIYEDCPEGYHVDHIIPVQGKNVSGLHVHTNLQYLLAADNIKKGNKYEDYLRQG
jgi:hypothetical protein